MQALLHIRGDLRLNFGIEQSLGCRHFLRPVFILAYGFHYGTGNRQRITRHCPIFPGEQSFGIAGDLHTGFMLIGAGGIEEDLFQLQDGIAPVGLVNNFLKAVMRDDTQQIHRFHAATFAIRQAQAAPDGLLYQGAGIGGAQWHDGVEVGDVPAFFEHIDVNDDFRRFIHAFHGEQAADHFLFLFARFAGIHLNDFAFIAPAIEIARFQQG